MIRPDLYPAKLYKTNVIDNNEQTETERVGVGFLANQISYKSTTYDATLKIYRPIEQLVISTRFRKLDFQPDDIIEIKNTKWKIVSVNNPNGPFGLGNKDIELTLRRS